MRENRVNAVILVRDVQELFVYFSKSKKFKNSTVASDPMNSPLKSIDISHRSPAPSFQGDIGSPSFSYSSYDPQFGTTNLEVVDSDLAAHDDILDEIARQAKSSTKAHLIEVKKRLIEEKQAALQKAESEYLQQYGVLQDEISGLKRDLHELDASKEADATKYEGTIQRLTTSLFQKHKKSISTFSVQKLFNTWKLFAVTSMYLRKLDKSVAYFSRKTLLNKTLSTLRINCQHRKANNFEAESKFKFDQVTSEVNFIFVAVLPGINALFLCR